MTREEAAALIDAEYRLRGHRLGWRLLASPWETTRGAKVAFIGLNPGGGSDDGTHPALCTDACSAYEAESWAGHPPGRAPLQKQVLALFRMLGVAPQEVLAGNIIPFRSRSLDALGHRAEALRFGREIWRTLLHRASPELVVAMGKDSYLTLSEILRAAPEAEFPAGWGRQVIRVARGPHCRLVGMPHLSRFPIVTRPQSRAAIMQAFGDLT